MNKTGKKNNKLAEESRNPDIIGTNINFSAKVLKLVEKEIFSIAASEAKMLHKFQRNFPIIDGFG